MVLNFNLKKWFIYVANARKTGCAAAMPTYASGILRSKRHGAHLRLTANSSRQCVVCRRGAWSESSAAPNRPPGVLFPVGEKYASEDEIKRPDNTKLLKALTDTCSFLSFFKLSYSRVIYVPPTLNVTERAKSAIWHHQPHIRRTPREL